MKPEFGWRHPAFRALPGLAAAWLIWLFPSSVVTDALVWGAFLWALPRGRQAASLWLSAPGLAALLVALYPAIQLAWCLDPAASAGVLLRDLRLAAGAFALSVAAREPVRIERTLLIAAVALLPVFALDLARLGWALGPALLEAARYRKPYALNHPNVSSLLAAAVGLIAAYGAWTRRRRPAGAAFGFGALLALAYLVVMASRAPQAAFAGAVGAAFWIVPRTWKGRLAGTGLALLTGLLIGANLPRINARFLEKGDPFSGRTVVWRHTYTLTQAHPWFGYGYGKPTFQKVYAESNPPPSPHFFPHPHQYALFVLFQGGRAWLVLHAALWLLLAGRLIRALGRTADPEARLRIALVSLLLLLFLAYGLGDYPDNRLRLALVALVPLAIAASAPNAGQAEMTVTRTSA